MASENIIKCDGKVRGGQVRVGRKLDAELLVMSIEAISRGCST